MRRWFAVATIFAAGTIFGPLLVIAIASAMPNSAHYPGVPPNDILRQEVEDMVAVHRANKRLRERGRVIHDRMVWPDYREECGHGVERLFSDAERNLFLPRKTRTYTPYQGLFWLDRWRSEAAEAAIDVAIAEQLSKRMSHFQSGFLRRCMETPMWGGLCFNKADALILEAYQRIDRKLAEQNSDYILFGHENDVICSFLDGIAARRGISLAKRPAATAR